MKKAKSGDKMLFAVECPYCRKRLWADVAITYERKIYASGVLELEEYVLKHAKAYQSFKDEEIAYWLKRTIASFIKMGKFSKKQIIRDVSKLYGIPEPVLEEIYDEIILEITT